MPKLWVPGAAVKTSKRSALGKEVPFEEEVVQEFRLTPGTRSRAAVDASEGSRVEVEYDDLLELELEDGTVIFTTVGLYEEDQKTYRLENPAPPSRSLAEESLEEGVIPFRGLPGRDLETRGPKRLFIRLLRVLRLKPVQDAAMSLAVSAIIEKIEEKLARELGNRPGLYLLDDMGKLVTFKGEVEASPGEPALLLIHGTASSTQGSFGGLLEQEHGFDWPELHGRYSDRVYALEHRTLSQSPIDNAIELAKRLPVGAELHLVTHSRGGLVGELLSLDPGQIDGLERYQRAGDFAEEDQRDREALRELRGLLEERQLNVTRFVRVACPARGTVLLSKRLDVFFSVLFNLVGQAVSGPVGAALLGLLSDSVKTVLRKRSEPEEIPGLEAQMPSSPLVRFLNTDAGSTSADLSVIAGDLRGGSFGRRLLNLTTHLYFWEHNDLVVDTRAMYGGVDRAPGSASFLFDPGPKVTHFRYFKNDTSRGPLAERLSSDAVNAGFELLEVGTNPSRHRAALRAAVGPRPVVFLLPGIMGSHLSAGGDRIWLDKSDLAKGRMKRLGIGAPQVTAQAIMDKSYRDLANFLALTHEVVEFPFDWRRSVLDEGTRLGKAVEEVLDVTDQPVRLLAHSMGGLVCRAMMVEMPGVWQRLCERDGGRLVQLGTPNRGSYTIPRLLLGREGVLKMLALLDFRHSRWDLLKIIRRFPGILEMLPSNEEHDFFDMTLWEELKKISGDKWPLPDRQDLDSARETRRRLDQGLSWRERIVYVAGAAQETPHALFLAQGKRVVFLGTSQGDGRVPFDLGLLNGVRTWYMNAEHGGMAAHEPAFQGILDLLQEGETQNLATEPSWSLRAGAVDFPLPQEDAVVFPDDEDLETAALGYTQRPLGAVDAEPIRVWVTHGDMDHARYPVALGHYEGDSINGAEKYLDYLLDRRLSVREAAGVYPGPAKTSEVVLVPGSERRGALVVGLGALSAMGPRVIREGVRQAVARYMVELWEREKDNSNGQEADEPISSISTGVSALLMGTGLGSNIQTRDSLQAILQGVMDAEHHLRETSPDCPVQLDEIEIIEFFEEKAVKTAHALLRVVKQMGSTRNGSRRLEASRRLRIAPGGRRTSVGTGYHDPWYQQLIITQDDQDLLRFVVLADSSRTEVSVRRTQRLLVDRLMAAATGPAARERSLSSTLYELLIPNELKERAMDQNRLLLVVDRHTAKYPWELLEPAGRQGEEPLAVKTAMVRKLQLEGRAQARRSTGNEALVVGNPKTSGKAFPSLKGAAEEAELVADLLKGGGFLVNRSIEKSGLEVVAGLFEKSYQVLHIAAHGTYDSLKPLESGIVLDDGLFLTAAELGCLTVIPDLVFLNCCYLGQISETDTPAGRGFHELTASLAVQLMESGAQAVVAAGWAVEDSAAKTFARVFYDEILAGRPLGEAVQAARRETYSGHSDFNTWGAYQVYGDPGFRLRRDEEAAAARNQENLGIVSRREALDRLRQLVRQSESYGDTPSAKWIHRRDPWTAELERLEKFLGAELDLDGELLAVAGEAWRNLLDLEKASQRLRASLGGEDPASAGLRTLEVLCQVEFEWAETLYAQGAEQRKQAREILEEARIRLEQLLAVGRTPRRLSLAAEYELLAARLARRARDRGTALGKAKEHLAEALIAGQGPAFETALRMQLESRQLLVRLCVGGDAKAALGQARGIALAARTLRQERDSRMARLQEAQLALYLAICEKDGDALSSSGRDLLAVSENLSETRWAKLVADLGLLDHCFGDRIRLLDKKLATGEISKAEMRRLKKELAQLEKCRTALLPIV